MKSPREFIRSLTTAQRLDWQTHYGGDPQGQTAKQLPGIPGAACAWEQDWPHPRHLMESETMLFERGSLEILK